MLYFLLVAGCEPEPAPPVVEPEPVVLEGPQLLRRLSLDLRGIPPTVAELDAVEADPSKVWEYRDAYLDDPLLEERLIELFNLSYFTLITEFQWSYADFFPVDDGNHKQIMARQVGEEPLRYMARIAMQDRPWTDVVTGETTLATPLMATFTPVDYPEGDTGWQEVEYSDNRPSAGILSMNAMWWRYESTNNNNNRSRAAAITRILLCRDLFARNVAASPTAGSLSIEETEDAVHNQDTCVACHSTLDPLAANLFGFYTAAAEIVTYRAEREALAAERLEVEPAYFGTPVGSLTDVGQLIAQDPRFPRCTVEQMSEALWGREIEDADKKTLDAFEQDFLNGGLKLRPLISDITDSTDYRLGGVDLTKTGDELTNSGAARMVPVDVLADSIEAVTGFRWVMGETDMMADDFIGFRQVAGGVDGITQLRNQRVPGVMWALVTKSLAEAAAGHVVTAAEAGTPLITHATLETRPGDPAFALEVQEVHWRLTATRMTAEDELALEALWTSAEAVSDAETAWQAVFTVLLRDPGFLFY